MKKPLTVLQTLPRLDAGGVETGTLEISSALVKAGHRAIVVSGGGRMVSALEAAGATHIKLPIGEKSLLTLRYVPTLMRIMREQRVDILHSRSRFPAFISYLAWRFLLLTGHRIRLVTTVHGAYSVNKYSRIMLSGERVIATSKFIERYIKENYPYVAKDKICLIYRGIDPEKFPGGFRPTNAWLKEFYTRYPRVEGKFILTMPGRISPLKGHDQFIDLVENLLAQQVPVHGIIAGMATPSRKKYLNRLTRSAQKKGLENHLTFASEPGALREIMAISDVVVSLNNKAEAFGRTVVEALSMKIPVIGYALGGVEEILSQVYPEGLIPAADLAAATARVSEFYREKPPPVVKSNPFLSHAMNQDTLKLYETLFLSKN